MRLTILLLFGVTAAASSYAGEVYKWIDKDGKVNYSDHAPVGTQSEKMAPGAPPADPDGARRLAAKQAELLNAAKAEEAAHKAAEDQAMMEKQKQETCAKARGQLDALRSGSLQLYQTDQQGQASTDDKARDQAIRDTEQMIDTNCG